MSNIPETGRTSRVTVRLIAIQILVLSLLLTLGGRLWYLQVRNGDEYEKEAAGNHVQQVVDPAVRGSILDSRGVPIADNETRLVVSVSRTELTKMDDEGKSVLERLAKVLGTSSKELALKVRLCDAETPQPCWNGSPYQPIPVSDEATSQQVLQIRERAEDFPGVTAEPTAVRRYPAPNGANTSQVLGYLSPVTDEEIEEAKDSDSPFLPADEIGRSGLERAYDSKLRGSAGVTRYEVDNLGRVMGRAESDASTAGANLVTSIDSRVQAVAEKELDRAMKDARTEFDKNTGRNYEADAGSVIVMENDTGRVVSMASNPEYDPNSWVGGISGKEYKSLTSKKSNYPLLNRGIQALAAPGSIFKVVPTTAAVNAGYPFDGNYDCPGSYSIGGQTFTNMESESYGTIDLGRALEVSCDTVFYDLAYKQWRKDGGHTPKKNAKDWFYKTAHQFGLGDKTGIDLPNEVEGRVPDRQWKKDYYEANKDVWCQQGDDPQSYADKIAKENCVSGMKMRAGDSVNYSIGQGDTLVTPIQMATAYAALGNGGTLYDPTLGKAIVSADGKHVKEIKPTSHGKLPTKKATLKDIDGALQGVATRGTAATNFGTGWPQEKIPMRAKTGTAEVAGKQTTSWFATYTDDYTVLMTISQGGTGSGASGPAVRRIYDALYGVGQKALLPKPEKALPKISKDGSIQARRDKEDEPKKDADAPPPAGETDQPGEQPRSPQQQTGQTGEQPAREPEAGGTGGDQR
ncbi:penicillin-binding protein 2 [Streptomyces sulphureus]|uniref:penicillin-binding protein 2 n=1 Tax=Streptomyces sulphureus TaxID=47758 RepID=UPI00037A4E87|nr:penicillin-binding protein 2 [Streptomyces sulphureus]